MNPLVVVVDPGHGGRQSYGAMWPTMATGNLSGEALERALEEHLHRAVAEKDINLNIALALDHALQGCGWPVACELTRETDDMMGLQTRAEMSAKYAADIVVSIHCDTSSDGAVAGLWTYVREGDRPAYSFARDVMISAPRELRRATLEPCVAKPQPHWTGRAHAVLAHHQAPAVLIECGFLSNGDDRELLTSEAGQAGIVACVMGAVAGMWRRAGG